MSQELKGTNYQAQPPNLEPQNVHGVGRASSCMLSSDLHAHDMAHVNINNINKLIKFLIYH